MSKSTIQLMYEAAKTVYEAELEAYNDAIKRGVPEHLLAKPEPPESPVTTAMRISQQNNFRIGYDKYWHSKSRK